MTLTLFGQHIHIRRYDPDIPLTPGLAVGRLIKRIRVPELQIVVLSLF